MTIEAEGGPHEPQFCAGTFVSSQRCSAFVTSPPDPYTYLHCVVLCCGTIVVAAGHCVALSLRKPPGGYWRISQDELDRLRREMAETAASG